MITIEEIAKLAGVSLGTVDRALHDRGRVSVATKNRILEITKEYGYKPNAVARSLKFAKTHTLGVLLPSLQEESGLWNSAKIGIEKAGRELENLSIEIIYEEFESCDLSSFQVAFSKLLSKNIKGLITIPGNNEDFSQYFKELSIPYIFIGSVLPSTNPLTCICQNHFQSGLVAGRVLSLFCPHGKKFSTIYLNKEKTNKIIQERNNGIKAFFKDSDVVISDIALEDFSKDNIINASASLDGLIVLDSKVYKVAEAFAKHRENRPIIIGYNDVPLNKDALIKGKIECIISQKIEDQGYFAMRNLCRKIVLGQDVEPSIEVNVEIRIKENA